MDILSTKTNKQILKVDILVGVTQCDLDDILQNILNHTSKHGRNSLTTVVKNNLLTTPHHTSLCGLV